MNTATILEITTFRLNDGVSESQFLKAADKMQQEFLTKAAGFISRTLTLERDDTWRDVIFWKDKYHLEETAEKALQSEIAAPFMSCIDLKSVEMKVLEIKAHY